ncbi:MAG: DUF3048 domain-containing protein [Lachnospiraceae bacterium]|nr:DUF3048 domain-containing protein [Lachnospiraceae bacterium]
MKKRTIALLLTIMMGLSGCAGLEDDTEGPAPLTPEVISGPSITPVDVEPSQDPVQTPDAEDTPAVSGEVASCAIGERVERDGKIQSRLTGEWKDTAVANRRPMAVMIPNNQPALPQYGIAKASVIFEAPMEKGSCTRLMGIFEDYDDLDYIGPLRSSRFYFLQEACSFDAIYCNWGLAVPYVGPTINSEYVDNISAAVSGIDDPSDEAFTRSEKRKAAGYATEYTGIMTIDGYNRAVARQGYETGYRDRYEQGLQFADDVTLTYENKVDVKTIYPGGNGAGVSNGYAGSGSPYFVYNPEDGLYYRYQFGKPQIDERTGEQLAVKNVILKITEGSYLDEKGYLSLSVDGVGECLVFTEGKAIAGFWSRQYANETTLTSATHYYYYDNDEEKEVVLNQGKTWVCLVWSDYADQIIYYDTLE